MAVAVDEDRRRKRTEAYQLRQRLGDLALIGGSGEQQREGDAELFAINRELPQVALRVVNVLVPEPDDLKSFTVVLLVQLLQHRRLVVAVGTPGAEDIDNQ